MPIGGYYKGNGKEVMRKMKRMYGKKRGEEIFYANAKEMRMEGKKGR